ncbi:MAG: sigma-70 family RNA polymerase sigma factor [Planctomycetota bacterium]
MDGVTQILSLAASGDAAAQDQLFPLVYDGLRKLAGYRLQGAAPGQSLQPTDLVHEAYVKLVAVEGRSYENRRHFMDTAGKAMRSILVDRARARMTEKRGGGRKREPLHEDSGAERMDPAQLLEIDDALTSLAEIDARAAKVVELRFFVGLAECEIAEVLGITDRTVRRDWTFARAWLGDTLGA